MYVHVYTILFFHVRVQTNSLILRLKLYGSPEYWPNFVNYQPNFYLKFEVFIDVIVVLANYFIDSIISNVRGLNSKKILLENHSQI